MVKGMMVFAGVAGILLIMGQLISCSTARRWTSLLAAHSTSELNLAVPFCMLLADVPLTHVWLREPPPPPPPPGITPIQKL